jgi:hypothetical protein
MPTARTKASRKFNSENYERMEITVLKGQKDIIKKYAKKHDKSFNNYVKRLIYKDMGIPEPTIDQVEKD